MEYYYRGVVSWDWFYPHHYAPMISDMTGLAQIRVAFEPGQPFRPFQQLLAVLPAASAKLLPSPYQVRPQPCILLSPFQSSSISSCSHCGSAARVSNEVPPFEGISVLSQLCDA